MIFTWDGQKAFSFHVLGSTIGGISSCYIDIYVNGNLYISNYFIDKDWKWLLLASSNFNNGSNTVKIVSRGNTHLWLDEAKAE